MHATVFYAMMVVDGGCGGRQIDTSNKSLISLFVRAFAKKSF